MDSTGSNTRSEAKKKLTVTKSQRTLPWDLTCAWLSQPLSFQEELETGIYLVSL